MIINKSPILLLTDKILNLEPNAKFSIHSGADNIDLLNATIYERSNFFVAWNNTNTVECPSQIDIDNCIIPTTMESND